MGADAAEGGAEKLRGNDGDNDLRIGDGGAIAGDGDRGGNGKAGEELRVFSGAGDLAGELGRVGPEGDFVTAAAVEGESEGGSPCAGTQDGDAAHAGLLAPKRDSVPANRRRMFS